MALHELYIGGPPTRNYSRAMLPAPPFVASAGPFQQLKVAAHKGPTSYGLTRVLDTEHHSVSEFLQNTPVVADDVLGVALIPKNVVLKGFFYEVERVAGNALVVTPSLRGIDGATLPEIDCNTLGKGFAMLGDGAWITETGAISGDNWLIAEPTILDLTIDTMDEDLGGLRLVITPLVDTVYHGEL